MVHRSGRDPTPIFFPIEQEDLGKGAGGTQTLWQVPDGISANVDNIYNLSGIDRVIFANEGTVLFSLLRAGRVTKIGARVNSSSLDQITTVTLRKNQSDTRYFQKYQFL